MEKSSSKQSEGLPSQYHERAKRANSFIYLVEKAIKLSINNIWRNKFLSLATIFVIGTIIFIFNVILVVNFIATEALDDLGKKIDIVVYLKENTPYEATQKMIRDLESAEGVESVSYTSKEDALKQLKTTHPDISLAFEKYRLGNPLPESLSIITKSPQYHKQISDFLSQEKYQVNLSNVITNNSPEKNTIITSVSKNLMKVTDFTHQIIFWLIIIFVIGGALITLNALQITIFNRKQEIIIMKLVGASHWFIRLPFIIESVIYGFFAILISFIMLFILSQKIQIQDTSLFSYYSGIEFYKIFIGELIATIGLSIASSMAAIHEYLEKKLH